MINKTAIVDASGRYLGTMSDPAIAVRYRIEIEIENPRAVFRGVDVREALAGEVPICPELAAELAHGRRV